MTQEDKGDNNITIGKRTLILSIVVVMCISILLLLSGPLASLLLLTSTIKQVRAQQQPTSQPPPETTSPTQPPPETTSPTQPPPETTSPTQPPPETTSPTQPPPETTSPTQPPNNAPIASDLSTTSKLTVVNKVVGGPKGTSVPLATFFIGVRGNNPNPRGILGSETGTNVTLGLGNYTVTEIPVAGYIASYSSECKGTVARGGTIEPGGIKTCTITNHDAAFS